MARAAGTHRAKVMPPLPSREQRAAEMRARPPASVYHDFRAEASTLSRHAPAFFTIAKIFAHTLSTAIPTLCIGYLPSSMMSASFAIARAGGKTLFAPFKSAAPRQPPRAAEHHAKRAIFARHHADASAATQERVLPLAPRQVYIIAPEESLPRFRKIPRPNAAACSRRAVSISAISHYSLKIHYCFIKLFASFNL